MYIIAPKPRKAEATCPAKGRYLAACFAVIRTPTRFNVRRTSFFVTSLPTRLFPPLLMRA